MVVVLLGLGVLVVFSGLQFATLEEGLEVEERLGLSRVAQVLIG
jgi:hypothetical protein